MYIAIDFETTGLLAPTAAPLDVQPHIVQIAFLLLDPDFAEVTSFNELVRPPIHIPAEVSRIHGITDDQVKDRKTFAVFAKELRSLSNEATWIGQNVPFDQGCLYHELRRLGTDWKPTPSLDLMDFIRAKWGKRRKLGDVYLDLFGERFAGAHDALADIRATVKCLAALRKEFNV